MLECGIACLQSLRLSQKQKGKSCFIYLFIHAFILMRPGLEFRASGLLSRYSL